MSTRLTLRPIKTDDLLANPANVREHLDGCDELAASMLANGVLQPLIVNDQVGTLIVTDGHRRLEAARRAHIPVVPCLVTVDAGERQVLTTMLAAAMHKELRPLEQAKAFALLQKQGVNLAEMARTTGYTTALISARLLLLVLPREVTGMLQAGEVTLGEATQLAKQVKATRTGSAYYGPRRKYLAHGHRLAGPVRLVCTHDATRQLVGGVGCGECWETTIRADERGELNVIAPGGDDVVDRILSGVQLPTSRAARLDLVRQLVEQRLSDGEIGFRLHISASQIFHDRKTLGLPTPFPQNRTRAAVS